MNPLDQLLKITAFGRQIFNGQHFSIKYRKARTEVVDAKVAVLKNRYPELLVYNTTKNTVIFGGTFHSSSNFMHECKFLMSQCRR